jgi:hypothetical protein
VTVPFEGIVPEMRTDAVPPAARDWKLHDTVVPETVQPLGLAEIFVGPPESCTVRAPVVVDGPAFAAVTSNQNGFFGFAVAADLATDTPRSALGGGGGATPYRTTRPLL